MAARKRKNGTTEGVAHTNVLLEQIRGDQRAMFEAMNAGFEGLRREMDTRFTRVDERLAILEAVVRQNSADIKRLATEIDELRAEIRGLRRDFDTREERERIAALEQRVAKLEQTLKVG
jgi:hypothetical protein